MSTELTAQMEAAGAKLTQALDEAGLDIVAAFWWYASDADRWRLVFATPEVDSAGPIAVYRRIRAVLARSPGVDIGFSDVGLASPSDTVVSMLRGMLRPGHPISSVRVQRSTVDGHFIEDAFVYRMLAA